MITSVNATANNYSGGMKPSNSPTENREALQAALNTGRVVHIPFGTFPIEGPLYFTGHGQGIFGQGPWQTVLQVHGPNHVFISNGKANPFMKDMLIRGTNTMTGGSVISFDGSPAVGNVGNQAWGGTIENIFMDQCWDGVYLSDINTVTIVNLNMQNMNGSYGIFAKAENTNKRVDTIRLTHVAFSSSNAALAANRGDGILIDGCVHTIIMHNVAIIGAYRGVVATNSYGLPFGSHVSFIFAHDLEVDFPKYEALLISHIDRCRFTNTYLHGSKNQTNVNLLSGVRDAKFVNCNITSAYMNGLYFDGNILDLTACEFDWNSQQAPRMHQGILFGSNAQNGRIVGGGATETQVGYGIYKMNQNTNVQLAAADAHYGLIASRNF